MTFDPAKHPHFGKGARGGQFKPKPGLSSKSMPSAGVLSAPPPRKPLMEGGAKPAKPPKLFSGLAHQVDPSTGKLIRQVQVLEDRGSILYVRGLNGPMSGAEYEIERGVIRPGLPPPRRRSVGKKKR